jgi:hypothetical protein
MQVSDFQTITYDETKQVLFAHVNEQTAFATTELVKEAQYAIVEGLRQYNPPYVVINLVELRFVVTPELQEWVNQEIIPHFFNSGVKKIAYIMPTEFIEKLSIEQVHDEVATTLQNEGAETQTNYFDNESEALRWFTQQASSLYKYA